MNWPKCEGWHNAIGAFFRCHKGKIKIYGEGYNGADVEIDCPACNGTGEAAKLTADEAAEFIIERQYEFGFPQLQEMIIQKAMGVWTILLFDSRIDPWRNSGVEEKTLTAALNAAARAVKERGKECPPK